MAEIRAETLVAVGSTLNRNLADRIELRLLRYAIEEVERRGTQAFYTGLIKVLDEEKKKDRLSPQDKEVFDRERRNVSILYGEKGPMAQYTIQEAQLRVAAFQRFDDLVFKKGLPRAHTLTLAPRFP